MKIAVFDFVLNKGGGIRFITNLMLGWKKLDPSITLHFYCNTKTLEQIFDVKILTASDISIFHLDINPPHVPYDYNKINRAIKYFKRKLQKFLPKKEVVDYPILLKKQIFEITKSYNVAYFPWPFLIPNFECACKKFATFHDFNFKYFFGSNIFSREQLDVLNSQIPLWIKSSVPIVSTQFMKNELEKFYPGNKETEVAYLAPFIIVNSTPVKPQKLPLNKKFILFPTHLTVHKNIGPLLSAIHLINKKGYDILLVLTGGGSDLLKGKSHPLGLELVEDPNFDVLGLGYVSDNEIYYLVKNASVVVSSSLYEAGNGPGLDAWILGTPVAMSNIAAYREHNEIQGLKGKFFDPRNPEDIANKIIEILDFPEQALSDAEVSRSLILKSVTWEITSKRYLEIFNQHT